MSDDKIQLNSRNPPAPARVEETSQQARQNQTSAAPQRTSPAAPARRPLFRS